MKVLIVDNYDSYTFNLYQFVGELLLGEGFQLAPEVIRNDEITLSQIHERRFDRIILSPGPGSPDDRSYFGVSEDNILESAPSIPVFGVCLGMQGMAQHLGGKVRRAERPMHGMTSEIVHDSKCVFHGLPQNLRVMRYHSLVADLESLPPSFEITARVSDGRNWPAEDSTGEIMGIRHRSLPFEGVQFHPESFATEAGREILANFLFRPWRGKN